MQIHFSRLSFLITGKSIQFLVYFSQHRQTLLAEGQKLFLMEYSTSIFVPHPRHKKRTVCCFCRFSQLYDRFISFSFQNSEFCLGAWDWRTFLVDSNRIELAKNGKIVESRFKSKFLILFSKNQSTKSIFGWVNILDFRHNSTEQKKKW